MSHYVLLKYLHVLGVIMFLGNILVVALLKGMIAATKNSTLVAFGQKFVKVTDIVFFGISTLLIVITGIMMRPDFLHVHFLKTGFWLYVVMGAIWLFYFIPIQYRQARLAREFKETDEIPNVYWKLENLWNAGGILSLIIALIILYYMIYKPL